MTQNILFQNKWRKKSSVALPGIQLLKCDGGWSRLKCCWLLWVKIFEHSGVRVMAEGDYDAQTRIQTLLEYIHEREAELDERAEQKRVKLHQCVQLRHLENEARQVSMWIRNSESMITAGLVCPGSLHEAEQLRKEHDQFQPAIEVRLS